MPQRVTPALPMISFLKCTSGGRSRYLYALIPAPSWRNRTTHDRGDEAVRCHRRAASHSPVRQPAPD
jgi:hypothetical protein